MITAMGNYKGGKVRYWHDDDRSEGPHDLYVNKAQLLEPYHDLCAVDGRRAHEACFFKGDRISLVWFAIEGSWNCALRYATH